MVQDTQEIHPLLVPHKDNQVEQEVKMETPLEEEVELEETALIRQRALEDLEWQVQ